jgi:hypothetical protein
VSPLLEFEGIHVGLCRTLLTQMSEFAASIKAWDAGFGQALRRYAAAAE